MLDIGLPAMDGWAVLERIRDLSDVPVLMPDRARATRATRSAACTAGPMTTSPSRSATANWPPGSRRCSGGPGPSSRRPRCTTTATCGSAWTCARSAWTAAPVALTPTEFRLLAALVRHPGQTLTPDQLLKLAWNDPLGVGPDRVKFGVMRLRRKLGQAPGEPGAAIEAVRGFGYRYVVPAPGRDTATVLLRGRNGE